MKKYEIEVSTTGELFSVRCVGDGIDKRVAVCEGRRYMDTVVLGAIQGEGFFRALSENLDTMFSDGRRIFCGYVFSTHTPYYRRLPGCEVRVLRMRTFNGFDFDWIEVERISNG